MTNVQLGRFRRCKWERDNGVEEVNVSVCVLECAGREYIPWEIGWS